MVNSNSPADNTVDAHHATGQHPQSAASAPRPTQQSSAIDLPASKKTLQNALRQFMDFPIPGIAFVDILPLFASVSHHSLLIDCLAQQISTSFAAQGGKPDVIVALDARGFLFGPSLALKLGSGFAPVRKRGKLPGPCVEASYEKEYGQDWFQMQEDAIKPGQTALVVDDIIATGEFFSIAWRCGYLLGNCMLM
jgi:adenine phosphoribosyltransferase